MLTPEQLDELQTTFVLVHRDSANLIGEYETRAEAELARAEYVAVQPRAASTIEVREAR